MKKSLLALSAAALVGGLGFMTAAQAIVVDENDRGVDATNGFTAEKLADVELGGVGHILFAPYYSVAGGNTTLISLVNTDQKNGKAVKVRFRGAANSDDVLDFTVLMSPGDVWTGSVERSDSGTAKLVSPDTTCVLPHSLKDGVDFITTRLDPKLSAQAKAAHTHEGYVEFLNMADIKPGTEVFKAVKHVNNVAPCDAEVMDMLMNTEVKDVADAGKANIGLVRPTGLLFGNWTIFNNMNVTSYGGGHAAVRAVDSKGNNGAARLFFMPQSDDPTPQRDLAEKNTADPVLVGGFDVDGKAVTAGLVDPVYVDLPDLSTPYTRTDFTAQEVGADDPEKRAAALSKSLAALKVMNEFVATPDSAKVPFQTDWVFSQPTRRYQAAVLYSAFGKNVAINSGKDAAKQYYFAGKQTGNGGGNLLLRAAKSKDGLELGDMLCLNAGVKGTNREEYAAVAGGAFSPLPQAGKSLLCGEVSVLTFNRADSKVLRANLTNERVEVKAGNEYVDAGWASVTLLSAAAKSDGKGGYISNLGLPVLGYAATAFNNLVKGINFGDAISHRYERVENP